MEVKDVPSEVYWVWICSLSPVGRETYEECQKIIGQYPEWFPWEHKYKSIPKEVHDAYWNEKYPDWDKPLDFSKKHDSEPLVIEYPPKDPLKVMEDYFAAKDRRLKEERLQEKKDKALWDKYYKKYKLEYRG